jgi:hypothetical protein
LANSVEKADLNGLNMASEAIEYISAEGYLTKV